MADVTSGGIKERAGKKNPRDNDLDAKRRDDWAPAEAAALVG